MFAYSVAMLMWQKEDKAEVLVDVEHGSRPRKNKQANIFLLPFYPPPPEFIKGCDLLAFSSRDLGFFQGVIYNQDPEQH